MLQVSSQGRADTWFFLEKEELLTKQSKGTWLLMCKLNFIVGETSPVWTVEPETDSLFG